MIPSRRQRRILAVLATDFLLIGAWGSRLDAVTTSDVCDALGNPSRRKTVAALQALVDAGYAQRGVNALDYWNWHITVAGLRVALGVLA